MILFSNAGDSASNIEDMNEEKNLRLEMCPWLSLSSRNPRTHASLQHDSPDLADAEYGEVLDRHRDEPKT